MIDDFSHIVNDYIGSMKDTLEEFFRESGGLSDTIIFVGLMLPLLLIAVILISKFLRSPFKYPYLVTRFDVSGKRNVQNDDLLDRYLIEGNYDIIEQHKEKVQQWKCESQRKIEKGLLKKFRTQQYIKALDDENMFHFILTRSQTRYKQRNYVRSAYKLKVDAKQFSCDYEFIKNRYEKLKDIGFECTLREYYNKSQRKLMTKELRKQIMLRDNYTCQMCGKYMPDEVGLHIDHIIPISKGGKTVPSNLQVLCSKCNGHKADVL